jgi:hypothetical protein
MNASEKPSLSLTNSRTLSLEELTIVPGRVNGGLSAGSCVAVTPAGADPASEIPAAANDPNGAEVAPNTVKPNASAVSGTPAGFITLRQPARRREMRVLKIMVRFLPVSDER